MSLLEQAQDNVGKSNVGVYTSSQTQEVPQTTPPPTHVRNTWH
jgi:hypothetical protein